MIPLRPRPRRRVPATSLAVRRTSARQARPAVVAPAASERGTRKASGSSSVLELLDLFGRRWALRVMWELAEGPLRFTQIQERCDAMSPSVLNQRLSDLCGAGVAELRADRRYGLTDEGAQLVSSLRPIDSWARRWARRSVRARA